MLAARSRRGVQIERHNQNFFVTRILELNQESRSRTMRDISKLVVYQVHIITNYAGVGLQIPGLGSVFFPCFPHFVCVSVRIWMKVFLRVATHQNSAKIYSK